MSQMIQVRNDPFGRVAMLDLNGPLVEHAHSHSHLLFWLNGSDNYMRVGDSEVPFDASHGVAVNSWEPHSVVPNKNSPASMFLLFYFDSAWLADQCAQWGTLPMFASPSVETTPAMQQHVQSVTSALLQNEEGADLLPHVIQLLEASLTKQQPQGPFDMPGWTKNVCADFRIRRSVQYMHEHLDVRSLFDDVARAAGLSRPHFFSLFRKNMNMTPSVFWNTLRVEAAIERLSTTEIPVSELAYDLGFTEPGNFTRFFRSHVGVPPSQYRLVGRCSSEAPVASAP